MCRNIKPLFHFEPPATDTEIRSASEQFVRKISGFTHPSESNTAAFEKAVVEVAESTKKLLQSLTTASKPRNREVEAAKAKERSLKRFGKS